MSSNHDQLKANVYMPVYNYERFLQQALERVLRQNYDDWEKHR